MTAAPLFADHHQAYVDAGWSGVLLLPPGAKHAPPTGYTGAGGAWPTRHDIERWAREQPDGNIGLRLPRDVIGVDVDLYRNADARTVLEERTGPLPPTWCSTSRVDGSGIRFYRVPCPPSGTVWQSAPVPGVEIIQHHHRYAVVWPSLHPEGRPYIWVDEASGEVSDRPPEIDELTELPWQAIAALTQAHDTGTARAPVAFELTQGEMSATVERRLMAAVAATRGDKGSRHDAACRDVAALMRLAERGEPGVGRALALLRDAFCAAVAPDRPGAGAHAEREFDDIVRGAERLVAATEGRIPSRAEREHEWQQLRAPTLAPRHDNGPAADAPWPDPIPLGDAAELPDFPIDALPGWIADHATSVADELQVPVDLPAMLGIAALATVAARRAEVLVRSTWREQVNLYLVVAMPPGSGKSPAFRAMLGPLEQWEAEHIERTAHAIAEAEMKHRVLEKAQKKAEEKGDLGAAAQVLAELRAHQVPKALRLIADDATPEALVTLLAEQGGRLALLSTEGGVFDLMTGRYGDRSNLDPYLQAWAGDTMRIDRVGRGAEVVRRPALTIGITVQPTVIGALADRPELAGRGLTARFMYSMPGDIVGRRNLIDAPTGDAEARARYDAMITGIAASLQRYETPGTLTLDPHAQRLFLEWRQGLEERRAPDGDLRPMSEWSTKLESSTARLAGLLYIAKTQSCSGSVDASTMIDALAVAEYWLAHAKAVHDLWGTNPVLVKARRIVEWLTQRAEPEFSVRDVYAANRRVFDRADSTVEPLELLMERGWIRPLFDGELTVGRRGRESHRFIKNPAIRAATRAHGAHEGPHARHARHARRDKNQATHSLTEKTRMGAEERAHGAHGAQLAAEPEPAVDPLADFEGLL